MLELDPNPPSVRPITDEDMDRLRLIHPAAGQALQRCVTCHGRKTFRWRDDQGTPADFTCDCGEQTILHLWLLSGGLDLRYQRLAWADAIGVSRDVVKQVADYAQNAEAYASAGVGLVMHGMRGNGKTMIAALLLKQLKAEGLGGYFTTFANLLDLYSSGWRSTEEKAWFDRKITNTGILVVDDMGRENDGRIKVAEEAFDKVLRARVAADRPTILTSNRNLKELGELYSLNALSLLAESSLTIEFAGEDYRERQRAIRLEEAKMGLTRPIVIS